jgi:hypothetical protein
MMTEQFDAAAAALARARTRREWIGALAIAVSGAILGRAIPVGAGQATVASPCRGKRSKCRRGGQCCSGRCRKRKSKNRGRCRCSRYLEPCREDGDCCPLNGNPLVCASETCQT